MLNSTIYRRGNLEDLSKLTFAEELSVSAESIEFNILGMGHEFWIAIEGSTIIGLTVMGRTSPNQFTVMYLQIAPSHKNQGIGSTLLRAIIENYAGSEFVVIPFDGTEEFYRRLGFEKKNQWEMRRPPSLAGKKTE